MEDNKKMNKGILNREKPEAFRLTPKSLRLFGCIALIVFMMTVNVQGYTTTKIQDLQFASVTSGITHGEMRFKPNLNFNPISNRTTGTFDLYYCTGNLTVFDEVAKAYIASDFATERNGKINFPKGIGQFSAYQYPGSTYEVYYCNESDRGYYDGTLYQDSYRWNVTDISSSGGLITGLRFTIDQSGLYLGDYPPYETKMINGTGVITLGSPYINGWTYPFMRFETGYSANTILNYSITRFDNELNFQSSHIAIGSTIPISYSPLCDGIVYVEDEEEEEIENTTSKYYNVTINLDIGNHDGTLNNYHLAIWYCEDPMNYNNDFYDKSPSCTNLLGFAFSQFPNVGGVYTKNNAYLPHDYYEVEAYLNNENKHQQTLLTVWYDGLMEINITIPDTQEYQYCYTFLDDETDELLTDVAYSFWENDIKVFNRTNTANPSTFITTLEELSYDIKARKTGYQPYLTNVHFIPYGGCQNFRLIPNPVDATTEYVYLEGYILDDSDTIITTIDNVHIECGNNYIFEDSDIGDGVFNFTNIPIDSDCVLTIEESDSYQSAMQSNTVRSNTTGYNMTLSDNDMPNMYNTRIKIRYIDQFDDFQPVTTATVTISDGITNPQPPTSYANGLAYFTGLSELRTYYVRVFDLDYQTPIERKIITGRKKQNPITLDPIIQGLCPLYGVTRVLYENHSVKEYYGSPVTVFNGVTNNEIAHTTSDPITGEWEVMINNICPTSYYGCSIYNGVQKCGDIIEYTSGTGETPPPIDIPIYEKETSEDEEITDFFDLLIMFIPFVSLMFILFIFLIFKKLTDEFRK